MESLDELQRFARERERLLSQLAEQRKALDMWFEDHIGPAKDVSSADLANLAGLVQLSRDRLMELVKLDDSVLERLMERRKEG